MELNSDPSKPEGVESLFNAALDLKSEDRAAYLDGACADDRRLRERLEALLRAHDASARFLPAASATVPRDARPTQPMVGDYELLEEIARGGMGVVYRARQRSLDRIVALKFLPASRFTGAGSIKRFRSEAATTAALQHPNIVAIHEVGETEGQPYYSMDYVDGQNLADLVRERLLPARQVASLLKSIAEAVQHAHERGILHRDLKPSNVLIDASGRPRIADFGLAKRVERAHESNAGNQAELNQSHAPETQSHALAADLTWPGQILGSPNYMPPEQASARRGEVGPASDVYSLGAILFHLLTGRPPFQAETIEDTLLQLLNTEPPAPRLLNAGVPRDLETICLKCLSKESSRRYASAQALAQELERFLNGEPIRARRAGVLRQVAHWCRRHPAPAAAAIGLVGVAIVSTGMMLHLRSLNRDMRLNLYVQDMNVALRSWQEGNKGQAFELLKRHLPSAGDEDLRGFEWRYLWKLCRGDYSQWLPKQEKVVTAIHFSPEGRRLATCSSDGTVRVFEHGTRSNLLTVKRVTHLGGFTEDGRSLLLGRGDHSLQLVDAQSGSTNRVLPNAGELVALASRVPLAVVITAAHLLQVLDLSESAPRLVVPNVRHQLADYGWGPAVAISADGRWLALIPARAHPARPDAAIRLWNLETRQELPSLPEHRQLRCLAFSPDGTVLAAGDGEGVIKLWNPVTRDFLRLPGHQLPVLSLAFSADSEVLAAGSAGLEAIRLWNVRNGEPMPRTFAGQVGDAWSLAFSPKDSVLASGSRDSPVRLWNLDDRATAETVPERLHADEYGNFCFSPDGQLMAGGCEDNKVRVWEVATLRVRGILHNAAFVAAFSKNGTELLASTKEGVPQWWNFETQATRPLPGYNGNLGRALAVDLSPDRRLAALGLENGEIELLEIDTGRHIGQSLKGHRGPVRSVAFSQQGDKLASGGSDKTVMVWDVHSQQGLGMCPEHKGGVFGVAISPGGQLLASGCGAATIKFWRLANVSTGSLSSISYHSSVVRTLAFSLDERTLASGSEDHTVKLWNIASRREVASFRYEARVRLVSFSPDGNTLVVITDIGTLRVLRAARPEQMDADWQGPLR